MIIIMLVLGSFQRSACAQRPITGLCHKLWLYSRVVERRTCDGEVSGSSPTHRAVVQAYSSVQSTHAPLTLSTSSIIIWYCWMAGDVPKLRDQMPIIREMSTEAYDPINCFAFT